MSFLVRIPAVEIVCSSLDELEAVVRRLGVIQASVSPATGGQPPSTDIALLRQAVESREGLIAIDLQVRFGVPANKVRSMLAEWAARVGLFGESGAGGFDDVFWAGRHLNKRTYRLTHDAFDLASRLLAERG